MYVCAHCGHPVEVVDGVIVTPCPDHPYGPVEFHSLED